MPTTFARTIASSVRGWCSMIFQTRSVRTTAPRITAMLMITPPGLRQPFSEAGRVPGTGVSGGASINDYAARGGDTGLGIGHIHIGAQDLPIGVEGGGECVFGG